MLCPPGLRAVDRELKEGDDVFELTEGILGMRGFVPLENALVFCSTQCLKNSFNGGKGRVAQEPKIP